MSLHKEEIVSTVEMYAHHGATIVKRLTGTLVLGFQSLITVDDETRSRFMRSKGLASAKRGHYDRAVSVLEDVYTQSPEDQEVGLHLAISCIKSGRQDQGLELLEAQCKADKDNIKAVTVLALIYAQMQDFKSALPLLKKASAASPEKFSLKYRLGVALDNLGKHDDAINTFLEALEIRPDDIKVLRSTGFAYEQKGDGEAALLYFKRANELLDE
jgi:tetratricopeptide (TPR) repeat protein